MVNSSEKKGSLLYIICVLKFQNANRGDKMQDKVTNDKSIKTKHVIKIKPFLFFVIWTLIIVKIFIFDWDIFVFNKYFPEYIWILKYKLLLLILIIILMSKMKIKTILFNIFYFILFYIHLY